VNIVNATCGFAMINHFFCTLCMQDLGYNFYLTISKYQQIKL